MDFNRDDAEGYVRYNDEGKGQEAADKGTEEGVEIKGEKPKLRCVSKNPVRLRLVVRRTCPLANTLAAT